MSKTNLEMWHELQNANASNSTGYMNEFVTNQNPLRSGGHVFTDSNVAIRNLKITRMASDSGGGQVISLEEYRDNLLTGRAAEIADVKKIAAGTGPAARQAQSYAQGRQ